MCINVETCPSYFIQHCFVKFQPKYTIKLFVKIMLIIIGDSVSVHLCYCVPVPVMAERETNLQEDGWVLIK